ncbi:MAG: helix-turn-helix domain-containing protein [Erythrobacter sp.]|jgi:excisionase family DNA binding protein|uniref:helix-turn-helix domain-containing protein n=1 Tax=Erythrobacteraceae TaxID=335929 RepID=UPI001E5F77BE|nr:helix-turn-helix domain-containing protein [Croceicoccus sp. Ery5]MCH2497190.1 helix-turn-helix domain-containing protein [Erythrobacter sp.]
MAKAETNDQRTERKNQSAIEPIAMRVPEACRYLGIGRSTLYVLINEGEIEIIKLGNSTLVLTESLRSLVERRRNPTDAHTADDKY